MRHSLLLAAFVAFVGLAAPAAQDGLSGAWAVSFNTPNGAIDASLTLKSDGKALSGTISGPQGDVELKGTVKGKTFTANFEVQSPNGNLSITINGEQDGDSIKGTFDFGQGTGDWAGKRSK